MTLYNDFVMTTDFVSRYSENDPGTTLARARDYCESAWQWSDDSDYDAAFMSWSDDRPDVEYDSSADKPLLDRLDQALDWLHAEDPWWWSSSDAVVVLDDSYQLGHEGWVLDTGTAIHSSDRGGIVDYAYEGDLNWSPIDNISYHELIHTYAGEHEQAGIFSDDEATTMASWNDDGAVEHGCYNYGTDGKEARIDYNAHCERDAVENHVDRYD
ncbi:hypothetical protein BRC81_12305 [Halobacteriales archaeon QS_1_68_20]|nr:MAG: hypothetical protein BRC81_12305 [Halobacteriales archaeon QS_1_68_20]